MATKTSFPFTEKIALDDLYNQAPDTATSQSFKISQLSYAISSRGSGSNLSSALGHTSFYGRVEVQKGQVSRQLVNVTRKAASLEDYTQVSMSGVNPIDVERKIAILPSSTIPASSPLYPFQSLRTGWDGYWADPLSQEVLIKANQLWRQVKRITHNQSDLPVVRPAANGSVAFTWSNKYPEKELEIWLYDQPDYYAEWMLNVGDESEEGTAQAQAKLLKVIRQYQEL